MEGTETGLSKNTSGGAPEGFSTSQIVRWLLALAVAIGAAAYYLIGVHNEVLCHGVEGDSGLVIQLCGAPGLSELAPFALVIAVLLAPDLSELGVAGLLSLKRTVERQEERQEGVEAQLARVEQRVSQSVSQKAENHFNLRFGREQFEYEALPGAPRKTVGDEGKDENTEEGPAAGEEPPEPPEDGGGGEAAANDYEPAEPAAGEPTEGGPAVERQATTLPAEENDPDLASARQAFSRRQRADENQALFTQQLFYLTKAISQYETIARTRLVDPGERMAHLTDEQLDRVDRWYSVFQSEIEIVKEVRNTVAHQPFSVSLEELEEANRIARRVLRILLEGIGVGTALIDRFEEQAEIGG